MTNHHIDAQTRQNLQTALRALTEAEAGPDAATLFAAPILTLWQPILLHHNLCLAGEVTGHPHLRADWITTSPLIALAPDLTWARTLSRLYRLGTPLDVSMTQAFAGENKGTVVIVDAYGWPAVSIDDARRYLEEFQVVIRRMAGKFKDLRN